MFRMFVLLAVISSTFLGSSASARTWYIKADGTGDAPTIQAGIDSAAPGDVVLVAPGIYSSTFQTQIDGQTRTVNALITKDISLKSESGASTTTIDASDVGVVFVGAGVGSSIEGFEITVSPEQIGCVLDVRAPRAPAYTNTTAIRCDASSCTIEGNIIHDADIAVDLHASSPIVTANIVSFAAWGVDGATGSNATISSNSFTSCGVAVEFVDSAPVISHNNIALVGGFYACVGVACWSHGPANAFTPTISDNVIGPLVNDGILCHTVNPTIEGNTVKGTGGVTVISTLQMDFHDNLLVTNSSGVHLQYASGSIEHNTFDGNGEGILLESSTAAIARNVIVGGSVGIDCFYSVLGTVSCNDVFGMSDSKYSGCPDQTGLNGNFSLDPQFCGIAASGNYYLQADSPCAPGNHRDAVDCGRIGAFDVNCSTVRVRPVTWGYIKSLYRK